MHIVVWSGSRGKQVWHWHFKARNGRIVADAEAFPSKAHAIRAAKSVVKHIAARYPLNWETKEKDGRTILRWA